MAKDKIDKTIMIQAIYSQKGFLSNVAAMLKIDVRTIYNYRDRHPAVAEAILLSREDFDLSLLDLAEVKLGRALSEGQAWAIRYVLDKKGVSRGYAPNLQSQSDEKITVEVIRE